MAIKNKPLVICFYAWETTGNNPLLNEQSNMTMQIVKDGGSLTNSTNSPSQIDSTGIPGAYKLTLTSTEMNADFIAVGGSISTSGVIYPSFITTEKNYLPMLSGDITTVSGNIDIIDTNVDTISGDINTLTNNLFTTSGNVTRIANQTDYLPSGLIDTVSHSGVLASLLSMAQGKFVRTGDSYVFYNQDNTTIAYTLDITDTERTRS